MKKKMFIALALMTNAHAKMSANNFLDRIFQPKKNQFSKQAHSLYWTSDGRMITCNKIKEEEQWEKETDQFLKDFVFIKNPSGEIPAKKAVATAKLWGATGPIKNTQPQAWFSYLSLLYLVK